MAANQGEGLEGEVRPMQWWSFHWTHLCRGEVFSNVHGCLEVVIWKKQDAIQPSCIFVWDSPFFFAFHRAPFDFGEPAFVFIHFKAIFFKIKCKQNKQQVRTPLAGEHGLSWPCSYKGGLAVCFGKPVSSWVPAIYLFIFPYFLNSALQFRARLMSHTHNPVW